MLLEEKARRLVDLAEKAFPEPPLGKAERKMLRAAALGTWANLRVGNAAKDDPAGAEKWDADRAVRAELLRWLCTEHEASGLVDPRGVQVRGVRINGELDLSCADVPFRLGFFGCAFPDGLNLRDAHLPGLFLNGSHTGPIKADGVTVTGDVCLRDKFHASGEVCLLGASVGGNLDCSGGTFENPNGAALSADGIRVTGDVFLNQQFRASGMVRLLGASVGGDLVCSGGTFENPDADALSADRIRVTGSVFLGEGFHATGMVRLVGTSVGGNLDCSGGIFEGGKARLPDGAETQVALGADGIQVTRDVSLTEGFQASGEVRLPGASVGGDLACSGGTFENPDANALSADRIKVTGNVFLDKGFRASGMVRLLGASVGGDLACRGGIFKGGKVRLPDGTETQVALSADGIEVTGSVFLDEGFRATGEVSLPGASVGGDLAYSGGRFENPGGDALIAETAHVTGAIFLRGISAMKGRLNLAHGHARVLVDDRAAWPERGELVLDGFTYEAIEGETGAKGRLEWLKRQYPEDRKGWRGAFRPQPYDQLAAVLRRMGHEKDAAGILVGKQGHRRKYGTMGKCARAWNRLMGATIGHGYKVALVAWWALVLWWLLGVLIFWQGHGAGLIVRPGPDAATPSGAEFSPWIYSLDVLLPVVDLHQEAYWRPDPTKGCTIFGYEAARAGQAIRYWVWFEILGGWVLATLAVAGLSGIAQKRYP